MRRLALLLIFGFVSASAGPYPCDLVRVIDGDTVVCRIDGADTSVRADGYDTPEIISQCTRETVMAAHAIIALADLLAPGEPVSLALNRPDLAPTDQKNLNRYGRVLARVLVGGRDVSGQMFASGYARPYKGGHRVGWCQ